MATASGAADATLAEFTAKAVVAGIVLMAGAFAPHGYWSSPGAVLADGVRAATGLERVTRHPFFSGTVLAMGAHALLAPRLTGTVFFSRQP